MRYADIRELIGNGDCIAVRGRKGLFVRVTRLVTNSPYTHTGVAIWENGRLLMAQTNSGGAISCPLSQYEGADFDVFTCPVERRFVLDTSWKMIGRRISYSVSDLARIAAHRLFRFPLPERDDGDMVCSSLTAQIYLRSGWKPEGLPSIPSPAAVVAALKATPIFEVRRSSAEAALA